MLELGQSTEQVEHQPTACARRVYRLGERAEADLAQLMAMEAVAADEDRHLAGPLGAVRDHPGGGAADLHVVEADIALAHVHGAGLERCVFLLGFGIEKQPHDQKSDHQNQGENEHAQCDDAVKPPVGIGWKDVGHGA